MPVTAEEREAYLKPPLDGSRRAFFEAIRGREASLPRRPWLRSQRATLAGIPAPFGLGLIVVGAGLLWRGLAVDEPWRWLPIAAGALGSAYGLLVLAVRLLPPPGAAAPPLTPDEKQIKCRRFE